MNVNALLPSIAFSIISAIQPSFAATQLHGVSRVSEYLSVCAGPDARLNVDITNVGDLALLLLEKRTRAAIPGLWENGRTFPLPQVRNYDFTCGPRINSNGTAVFGYAFRNYFDDEGVYHSQTSAVRWVNGRATILPVPKGYNGTATAGNNSFVAAGAISPEQPGTDSYPVIWTSGGVMKYLPGLNSYPTDINDSGAMSGNTWNGTQERPVKWVAGRFAPLTTLGKVAGEAKAINAAGDIVGYIADIDGMLAPQPMIWERTGNNFQLPLPTSDVFAQGWVNDINNYAKMVGIAYNRNGSSTYQSKGVLWILNKPYFIDDLLSEEDQKLWSVVSASRINDSGWIVGLGLDKSSGKTYFVLVLPLIPPDAR